MPFFDNHMIINKNTWKVVVRKLGFEVVTQVEVLLQMVDFPAAPTAL